MSCNAAIPWAELVQYWAVDLDAEATDRVDEHLMGCASCSAEAARVAAVVGALRELISPVVTRAQLATLGARGARIRENAFVPGRAAAVFPSDVELLIHRLGGFDPRLRCSGRLSRGRLFDSARLRVASSFPTTLLLAAC